MKQGKMPSKPAKKAPPPMKKEGSASMGERPMESGKKPKPVRAKKM